MLRTSRVARTSHVAFRFVTLLIAALGVQAQWLEYPTPGIPRLPNGEPNLAAPVPRAADGKPDLSGLWTRISPKYRLNATADLKPEQIQPWARALVEQRTENMGFDATTSLCLPQGPQYIVDADSSGGAMVKIVQTPGLIIFLHADLTFRQIFLDGRPLERDPQPAWMGYSIGHWEGTTLVVESAGYNDRTWLDISGHPHTENLRIIERYRRTSYGQLDIEVTFADPAIYAQPWTVKVGANLAPDTELLEYVCNESSGRRERWVGTASDDLKSEVKVAPETLAKYVGTYVEQPKIWRTVPRVLEFTMENGVLYADMDGRGKERQIARSETNFSGFSPGLSVRFIADAQGTVAGLFVQHVSGEYRFARTR